MNTALSSLFAVLVCSQAPLARHQTTNFVVCAQTPEVARLVAESAETHRQDLAKHWFGKKIPDWSALCQINVTVSMSQPQAFTEISYSAGKVLKHKIEITGALDQILKGPLPHELMHVLLAHYFGSQAPRWADEGAAILSETEGQEALQRKMFRKILAAEKHFPMRQFLAMRDYPADMKCLYAQGHSVSRFLVSAKGRPAFLTFVRDGLQRGWDDAVRNHYGYKDIEQMEKEWIDSLKAQHAAELQTGWVVLAPTTDDKKINVPRPRREVELGK
jgi:hypothetical protein